MADKKCFLVSLLFIAFILQLSVTSGSSTNIATTDNCNPTKPTKPSHPVVPHKPPHFPPKGPPVNPFCPRDTLKLGVCADLLGGLVNIVVGTPPNNNCCTLLQGLTDLEVAACLCTAIKANVLGINLNVPVSLSALVSACGKSIPPGFKCV